MTDGEFDGGVERLVKAKWLAIGLSQADLAEILEAATAQTPPDGGVSPGMDAVRRRRIAEALGVPLDYFRRPGGTAAQDTAPADHDANSLENLLGLRLLRAFSDVRDLGAKWLLVRLAEQIVKRQAGRG
jgi:transcriptional regulator with XRE-family HTH domain